MAAKAKEYDLHVFTEVALSFIIFLLSIFIYVSFFNLSPSLFNNTQFWFFISNALILIIFADYASFSPSKHNPDFHNEDFLRIHDSSFTFQPYRLAEKTTILSLIHQERETQPKRSEDFSEKTKIQAKCYRRSKSEKAMAERKITMRRSKTVKQKEALEEEENEFEKMTDEELNRRVEEFIQRFNRHIRLQDIGHGDEV